MKYSKYVFALLAVVVLLTIAMPAAAQGPVVMVQTNQGKLPIFVRAAGTNEDPFGGFCRNYFGALSNNQKDVQAGYLGAPADFGLNPFGRCDVPGGVPSANSGDGTSIRKAIYIGGAWDPSRSVRTDIFDTVGPKELPSCATVTVPAGVSRWFKADTWANKKLQVWLDDEKNDAKTPSGAAVWGAANGYTVGTAPGDGWSGNLADNSGGYSNGKWITGPFNEGFYMAIYDPDNLKPNFNYPAPNASILTVNVNSAASPRGSGNYELGRAFGGGVSVASLGAGGIHGYASFNPFQPSHLLWYEAKFDGWVYIRVYNQMIWDGVASVCTYRATTDKPGIN